MIYMNPIQALKNWYARAESKNLGKLTLDERNDLKAFDATLKRNWPRYAAILVALWLAMGLFVKLLLSNIGWFGAFALSAVVLMSMIVALTSAWFGPSRFKTGTRSIVLLLGVTLVGAIAGGMGANIAKTGTLTGVADQFVRVAPKILVGGLIAGMVYAVLMVSIVQYRRGQLQRRNQQLERQAQQERMGRQLADARLKLMQAQVEPHFLFNTLASVQQLAEGKAPEAAQLTAQVITFLRGGLASLRDDSTTLGCETAERVSASRSNRKRSLASFHFENRICSRILLRRIISAQHVHMFVSANQIFFAVDLSAERRPVGIVFIKEFSDHVVRYDKPCRSADGQQNEKRKQNLIIFHGDSLEIKSIISTSTSVTTIALFTQFNALS